MSTSGPGVRVRYVRTHPVAARAGATPDPPLGGTMLRQSRKALVAALGALASLVALGVLPSPYQEIAVALVAVATSLGVYSVPNELTRRQLQALAGGVRLRNGPGAR